MKSKAGNRRRVTKVPLPDGGTAVIDRDAKTVRMPDGSMLSIAEVQERINNGIRWRDRRAETLKAARRANRVGAAH